MVSWLRRLWPGNGREQDTPTQSGRPVSARAAALETEARLCDFLVSVSGTPAEDEVRGLAGGGEEGRARSRAVEGGPRGCLHAALGLALSGRRVAAFPGGRELASMAGALTSAGAKLTPLVAHVWLDGHPEERGHAEYHGLEGTGALLAMAPSPQDALEITVAARLASEALLRPAVLAVECDEALPTIDVSWERVAGALGSSSDSISAPTKAQAALWGRARRRVPAWLDPARPVSVGSPASPVDAGAMGTARAVLFEPEVEQIVRAALAQTSELFGRPVKMLRRHGLDDAKIVIVAQGAGVPAAERAADSLRESEGLRVGCVGITWLAPFPAAELSSALEKATAVVVVERGEFAAGDEPPLLRRVRSALGGATSKLVSARSAGAPVRHDALAEVCRSVASGLRARKAKDKSGLETRTIRLDLAVSAEASGFPHRDALEARVKADHPHLLEQPSLLAPTPPVDEGGCSDRRTPGILGRVGAARAEPDSLPRVWGELLAPRKDGLWPRTPDPLVASGVVPALSSALTRERRDVALPAVSAADCTGCGACWRSCPEGAIGATVISLTSLLDDASRLAKTKGPAADATRRAHKHIARRTVGLVSSEERGLLDRAKLEQAWEWTAGKLGISDEARRDHDVPFEATLDQLERLRPIVTERFWHRVAEGDFAAEALVLAIDPDSCTGCGICDAECPEEAIRRHAEENRDVASALADHWAAWEEIEDTSGETCARAGEDEALGRMGAALLSRHCGAAFVGNGVVPGSGEQLALRLLTAWAEHDGQRATAKLAREAEQLRDDLDASLRGRLAASLNEAEISKITEALASSDVRDVGSLAGSLDRLGARVNLDRARLLELAGLTRRLGDLRQELVTGADGLGSARFALAVAGKTLASRIAPYPEHPVFAPIVVDDSSAGAATTLGVAEALTERHVETVRELRAAKLELEAPADLPERLSKLAALSWSELTDDERASCPPVLLVMDDAHLHEHGAGTISGVLGSGLPIKVLLLDGLQPGRRPDPLLLAMAHQEAYVLSGSLAHTDHLARGMEGVLAYAGPALVHVHTPVPTLHGFPAHATLERARLAVAARAHVLLRYDPAAEGAFGLRVRLDGDAGALNAAPEITLTRWAAGEARFGEGGSELPAGAEEACERRWSALLELSGVGGGLASRLERELRERLDAERDDALRTQAAELEAKLSEAVAEAGGKAHGLLTEKLLDLAVGGMEKS